MSHIHRGLSGVDVGVKQMLLVLKTSLPKVHDKQKKATAVSSWMLVSGKYK